MPFDKTKDIDGSFHEEAYVKWATDFKGYKETSKTWRWLVANMHKYGFIRTVAKERWHWEYSPGTGMFSRVPRSHPTWDFLV